MVLNRFSNNFSIAMDDVLADGDLSKMKPDQMLAAFLKLNIEDPNNSVETHNRLSEVMVSVNNAQLMTRKPLKLKDARRGEIRWCGRYDQYRGYQCLNDWCCCSDRRDIRYWRLCLTAAAAAAISISMALAGVVQAGANLTAAEKSLDAQEMALDSKRSQQQADRAQDQLEEEAAIMEMIMESKNQMVENVLKMMNASFGVNQKILAAGMAR